MEQIGAGGGRRAGGGGDLAKEREDEKDDGPRAEKEEFGQKRLPQASAVNKMERSMNR